MAKGKKGQQETEEQKRERMIKSTKEALIEKIKEDKGLTKEEKNWASQLINSHQIILTGAPGTGKTYAAKEHIANILTGNKKENGIIPFRRVV